MAHVDDTKAEEMAGVTTTYIHAGEYKAEMNKPLTGSAVAHLLAQVDELYDRFVKSVATGRGTTQKNVRDNYGKGRMLLDTQALTVGMVDRVATMEQVLSELRTTSGRGSSGRGISNSRSSAVITYASRPVVTTHATTPTVPARTLPAPLNESPAARRRRITADMAEKGLPLPTQGHGK
jgi:ClpP class serine protease